MSVEIYPVVHVQDVVQATEQSSMALELGADGVYLINHSTEIDSEHTLIAAFDQITSKNPDSFVGLNFLHMYPAVLSLLLVNKMNREGHKLPSGLWVDNALPYPEMVPIVREELPVLSRVKYLGGVAFKYTRSYTDNPTKAAQAAKALAPFVDVVTTTGPGTGYAAGVDKLKAMKEAIGHQRLAVASGVSLENLESYKAYVDEILVSTSLETNPGSGVFVERTLRDLIALAHS